MIRKVIYGILIFLILACGGWAVWERNGKLEAKLEVKTQEAFYVEWIRNCENAQIVNDSIVYDTTFLPGEVIMVPTPIDSHLVAEIILGNIEYIAPDVSLPDTFKLYYRTYRDSKELEGITFKYEIKTLGELLDFEILNYSLVGATAYNTAVITKPSEPTPVYVYRSGWYLMGAVGNDMQSWTSWTSIEAGIGYMTKKGVSFGCDYQYLSLPYNDENIQGSYIKARIGYFFGKKK